jgi:hypothetical protein
LLSACGSGGSAPGAQNQPSVAEATITAEKSGAIPVLDRTTSLLGTDADGNGVRDDIDAYINSLPDTPVQKKALRQHAAALNAALVVDLTNQAAVDAVDTQIMNASSCRYSVYSTETARKYGRDLEKYYINTKSRFDVYMKFNQASSGKVLSFTSAGSNCAP